ncbi:hypothetical protein INT43_008122, partial [Umbelopsis isabellina]
EEETAALANDLKQQQIDREEVIRQRRERVEQWRREREAAKQAEMQENGKAEPNVEASVATDTENTQNMSATEAQVDAVDAPMEEDMLANDENGKKNWSLENDEDDDDEEENMEVDISAKQEENLPDQGEFLALPKQDDELEDEKPEALVSKAPVRRNMMTIGKGFGKSSTSETSKPQKQVNGSAAKSKMRIGFGIGLGNKAMNQNANKKTPDTAMNVDKPTATSTESDDKMEVDQNEEDVDPLEAYMVDVDAAVQKLNEEDIQKLNSTSKANKKGSRLSDDDDEEETATKDDDDSDVGSEPEDILAMAAKRVKKKDLAPVDHSKMDYEFFRKDFYIEPPELKELTQDQVDLLRIELDGIKIRGIDCPKPVQKWTHCGLPSGCLEVIRKLKYEKPTSIQAQAIPAIMNGRDVIGVAKTGSGKTIAFLLPMFRHIKDQRPLESGEGPIGIIMTPTRELAVQIHRECKPFLKVLGLRAVCAYGGSPIKDQIADLKRGAEIIVCTPGRMIDLLCANSGRVTNLRRVTYMVLDEADRMFDMGFEPQVMKIVNNARPSKQTVLFSATFPRQMEALARKALKRPLEITVGGRSVVCEDVKQIVEVREEESKFVRLLEILGQFYNDESEDARTLIFVDKQEAADNLLRDLIRRGYMCLSLHGGKDQLDRDSTISDFKSGVSNILVATSVAARGLDVKQLKLVVNYECPNHMEDYVHRVGRTGRAGNKGTAYTFITPEQERYAMDIAKALKLSEQPVPPDLQKLVDDFQEKVKTGKERISSSGFGGKGLERLDKDRDMVKKFQKKAYGGEDDEESEDEAEHTIDIEFKAVQADTRAGGVSGSEATGPTPHAFATQNAEELTPQALAAKKAVEQVAARINALSSQQSGRKAQDIINDINAKYKETAVKQDEEAKEGNPGFAYEIEINDYPQKARWRVTNKEMITQIIEISGAAITTRGTYFLPGKQPGPGERKLYLFIEGDSEMVIDKAKAEVKRILMEATVAQMEQDARGGGGSATGRYSVV